RSRVVYSRIESVGNYSEIQHPSVLGCLEYLGIDEGLEIHHDGDLPARSGIGSSSSFTVGLLHALHGLRSKMVEKDQLADQAIEVEQVLLHESVGVQDQIMAAHGGFRALELRPGSKWQTRELIVPGDYLQALEQHVLLGFSGISRTADEHARAQIENICCGKTTAELKEIHGLASEALELIKHQANLEEIGRLLDKSWRLKRCLADGISSDWMDDMYDTALRHGAFGGKLMGAGGGGFFFFLAPPYRHARIKEALPQIKVWVPFKIDFSGSRVIFYKAES
ncbi:MAG: hypothetical protein WCJ75_14030, partial [Desulfomonile sp.]